ncbi:MAG TPA: tRNA pseudouridine(13) synthase TruD [Polyangiaceae bacterium]|nr:tRNA pseudouridine(13) synthase TruD [Polyangiaceae bacterium]
MTERLPHGRIKQTPEDFVVEEIAAYAPSGAGEHVLVRFTKRDMTTLDAVRAIAEACGCDPREAGFAGMKDRRAVTTQTMSLHASPDVDPHALAARALAASLPGIAVVDAAPHGNKIKPGHLAGNRFAITVRGIARDRVADVEASLRRVSREGVPNAFGAQRFGSAGDNAPRALAWLRGHAPAPQDPRIRRLLWSSLQSAVFNAVLDARVADGTWATPLEGDLLKLRTSGGLFVCTAVQTERERAERGEVSPTGPIVGARMRRSEGAPGELEQQVARGILGDGFDMARTRRLGEGSRRALRMWVQDLRWEIVEDDPANAAVGVRVYFVLPKGGYATTVLGAAVTVDETGETRDATTDPPEDEQIATLQESDAGPRSEAK